MLLVKLVRNRNELVIPAVIARLVSADEKNSSAQRIKCVKRSQGLATTLSAQFTHLTMTRAVHFGAVRKTKGRAEFGKESNGISDVVLFVIGQRPPPQAKLVSVLDLPGHNSIMP